jgi:hypothetical protein
MNPDPDFFCNVGFISHKKELFRMGMLFFE